MSRLCLGASCIASGALKVKAALEHELAEQQMGQRVSIIGTGCLGPCSGGPALMIDDTFYERLRPQDAKDLVTEHLGRGRVVERLTHKRPDGRAVANAADMDFFKRQKKIVLRNCGTIDPEQIEDYIGCDGLPGIGQGPDARQRRRSDRDSAHLRAARPRRRRLSHLAQVEVHPRGPGRQEVRRLQRRRGRSRRLHGPQRSGRRPAQRDRGHGDRRSHRGGRGGATSTFAPSIPWPSSG